MIRDTSIEALRAVESSGYLSQARKRAYEILYHEGPLTGEQLAEHGRVSGAGSTLFKRLSELELMGLVRPVGERVSSLTGHKHILWDVTSKIPDGPYRRPANPLAARLRQAKELLLEAREMPDVFEKHREWYDEVSAFLAEGE